MREVQIGARAPGADIEQPAYLRSIQQPQQHIHDIPHPDEIPRLRAIGDIRPFGPEQPRRVAGQDIVVLYFHDGDHLALVILVRAVNIEKLQPRPLRRPGLSRR